MQFVRNGPDIPERLLQTHEDEVVPYLYGGSTLECAIFETFFHEVPIDAPDEFVDLDDFAQRGRDELIPSRELTFVDPTNTAVWAQAQHQQFPDVDDSLWMSRHRDRDHALMLFGDRMDGVLSGRRIADPLARNAALRDAVLIAALRAGIEADRTTTSCQEWT